MKSANSIRRAEAISEGHLGPIILILLGVALPLVVIGTIGLATTMSANILDRMRELGVMHAIGARPARVRRIVTTEGVFLDWPVSLWQLRQRLGSRLSWAPGWASCS